MSQNRKFQFFVLVTVTCSLLGMGCNRKQAPQSPRTEIQDLKGDQGTQSIEAFQSSLERGSSAGACQRLQDLGSLGRDLPRYSYLHNLDGTLNGGLRIDEAPFVQMFLAEQFKVPSDDEFVALAKAKKDKGEISEAEYLLLLAMRKAPGPLFQNTKYAKTNQGLEEAFPGIFGKTVSLKKSLFMGLAMKVAPKEPATTDWRVLTQSTPLFTSNKWSDFPRDVSDSLGASLGSSRLGDSPDQKKEKLCGLVLWHRMFSQMLALKGFRQVAFSGGAVAALKKPQVAFDSKDKVGAYFDIKSNAPVVLSPKQIQNYNPRDGVFSVTASLPGTSGSNPQLGSLKDNLDLLEGLTYVYEATSPAAPWIDSSHPYILGKIDDMKVPAILPPDVHSLSLGLISMGFKNLAGLHLTKINVKGQKASDTDTVAGVLLSDPKESGNDSVVVRLRDVSALTRIVVYLDNALTHLAKTDSALLQKMNPSYDEKTLASLVGLDMFSQSKLDQLLSKAEQAAILKANLVQLQLPMAYLLLQMGLNSGKCVSSLEWNLGTGQTKPLEACTEDDLGEAKATIRLLAIKTRSPLLYKRASETGSTDR